MMDSAVNYVDDNDSDSDYLNVSDDEESSDEFEEEENEQIPSKRKLPIAKRRDAMEVVKNPLSKLNIKQNQSQPPVKVCLKRKISFPTTTKKENDGGAPVQSSISFQLISASQSPTDDNQTTSIPTTPTMELESNPNSSFLMPAPGGSADEPPYFPEKYGKLCAFCNLGERSQLGQGEMLRLELSEEETRNSSDSLISASSSEPAILTPDDDSKTDDLSKLLRSNSCGGSSLQQLNRRQKGLNKCKNPIVTTEYVDELEKIGHQEATELNMLTENGYYYVHRSCAMWSFGVIRDPVNDTLSNVSVVLKQSLGRKCSYCNHYGASAICKMNCQKSFHFSCIAASGSFQVAQTTSVYCSDHLGQVPLVCSEDINCRMCSGLGDVSNLMMCFVCGDHYHGACVGLAQLPGVRAGWQCKSCRICQICRIPDNTEGRSLACEMCDKLYHSQCLRPIMTTIPKYGWKCRCCRVCSDCGARTPGAGASSRWHNHFTVCDSCYQQRNKGYSCPVCRKAYRAAAYREMVKCSLCQKFVHSTCDQDADLSTYERRKELNPEYEYTCSMCKNDRMRRSNSGDDDSLSASQESLSTFDEMEVDDVKPGNDYGLGKGKPFVASKIAKKRLGLTVAGTSGQRPKGVGKLGPGFQKRSKVFDFARKRGPKSKMRGIFGVPGVGLQRPVADASKQSEDEPGTENRLVLCSAKDRFVLNQDICVMCGSIGTDQEGCLIACAQCGQCYHPYCVSVKVTKEILQKGWRCLDCTVCERCGEKNDECRLILCDDCDISYHIYCMDPPLETVPHGTWKCKSCAICNKCGANSPGINCSWLNNYTECGPCASQVNCSTCNETYSEGELIIQCTHCDRWLHCACDSIKNENEAEKCAEEGYICILCRPKDVLPPHLQIKKKLPLISSQSSLVSKDESFDDTDNNLSLALEGSHFVDGVYLSENGLQIIKALQTEPKRAKRKPKNVEIEKDAAILAAIESVVAGSADNSMEDIKMEPLDPNEEAQIYKDGMPWSSTDAAPEGFSLFTTETGQVVLRKKRQRNLQKLGIGGFSVRNRAVRTNVNKNDEEPSNLVAPSDDPKKKKPNRRKQKSKLVETYPAYLQEAFFGRPLLDSNVKIKLESSSSEDEMNNMVDDEKTIKLSLDELKMIETMRAKQQQKVLEEQKLIQLKAQQISSQNLISNGGQIQLSQKMQSSSNQNSSQQSDIGSFASNENSNITQLNEPEIKTELNLLDDDVNNSDSEAFKDVLGLPDLLDNDDLVNTIMNEDDDLTKADHDSKGVKDDLTDILSPHFNLDNMEDMLFKSVLTDESQESQESMLTNSMTSYSTQSTPSHQSEPQQMHLNQSTTPVSTMGLLQSPQSNTNMGPMMSAMNIQPQSPQIGMNQQMNPLNQPVIMQQQAQQMVMQSNIMQRQNSLPGPAMSMAPHRGSQFNPSQTFPNQAQWNASGTDNDFEMTSGPMTSTSGQVPKVNNHQKTAERMAEDEKLGDLSTISSVLYANQNHPELKIEYPQWSDRYKQILKKWRALPADKKAPYLQRARDNRSAQQAQLRTKKAQQVAPDLSPDGGTTSTNSTSPALSSTLSESSSLIDVTMLQQQQLQQPPLPQNSNTPVMVQQQQQQQHNQVDQDKITAQQKSIKEAEQERQWKLLQAQRAREQQMGIPLEHQRMADPNVQLQISTSLNDGSMSPVASPSPNSRNQFIAPANKGRMMMNPQSPSSFQHPGRPVSAQLQRQQSQRMNQSPFSPQATTPQSPHDLYPGSPSGETFTQRSITDEQQQFMHSPQTSKPVGQQQSPIHAPGTPGGPNLSPAYGQINQNQSQQIQAPNIRPLENVGGYAQAPGTPRPSFNPGTTRATVYARPDMFNKPSFTSIGSRPEQFSPQQQQQQPNQVQPSQQENNRQLRDLLQRQQAPTNLPPVSQGSMTPFSMESEQMKNQQNIANVQQQIQQQQQNISHCQASDNTFRQPLPPAMRPQRMQSMVGGQMVRSTALGAPQRIMMTPDNRPRLNMRPVLNQQQMLAVQQGQMSMQQQQRMPGNFNNEIMQNQPGMLTDQNIMAQRMVQPGQNPMMQGALHGDQLPAHQQQRVADESLQVPTTVNPPGPGDAEGIPDSVTAELEKLEQDENVGMDGVGDILGGLGDDDDDLLDSLTAEMGADFNILEYADPELDTTDDEKSTLLDSLELDETEQAKEEKLKNLEAEKLAKAKASHIARPAEHIIAQQGNVLQQMPNRPTHLQMPGKVNQMGQQIAPIDQQNINPGAAQHSQQVINPQMHNQQNMMGQQGAMNNFQRQQVRIKAIPPNQIPEIQQIHQQMMLQLQQAAANGKPMAIGTRLVANNNVIGTVVGPNNIQLAFPSIDRTGQQRVQQVRMVNPNMVQGGQNNPRMGLQQMTQNRPNMMQNPQQTMNPNIQGIASQLPNQAMVGQQQQQQAVPPPPYPEPPPPYPGSISGQSQYYDYPHKSYQHSTIKMRHPLLLQEQPLLLEDLLEQEKREQARHTGANPMDIPPIQSQQSILSDQDYEKLRADVLTNTSQNMPIPQMPQQSQQQQQQQPPFIPRAIVNKQWRPQTPVISAPSTSSDIVRQVPIFQANLQSAPALPPENIVTDNDKQIQLNYEQWLNQQNNSLQEQLQYYETEILELRKLKKSLNTKQRQLKKNGNELNEVDAKTLSQVTQEQASVQKHLESARKQARNHGNLKSDYDAKQKAKQMANNPHMINSPAAQMNESLMSPSPGGMNQNMIQQPIQSPIGNPIMAPSQSPLHSPSPMLSSQSPGPASILQSPGGHMSNAMSPYNTMQQSPRIGTPHSQIDDSPFSPNSGSMDSGRLTSPAPRMTSPQHRPSTPMQMMNRMTNNPGQFNQQNVVMNQQNRFVRPQMIPNDTQRMNMRMPGNFQQIQMGHNPNMIIRQGQYNPQMDSNQNQNNQQNMQGVAQSNQNMQSMEQQRAMQMRQMQIRQQQMMNQQQQQQQQQQNQNQIQNQIQMNQPSPQQQMQMPNQPNQSPIHQQPQSPLINQNASSPMPRSPMVHYQQQQQQQHQNPNSPMMIHGSPHMRRPPSAGPQGIENSPRAYMQGMIDHSNNPNMNQGMSQQQQQQQMSQMNPGGGGGNNGMHPELPASLEMRVKPFKLGLRGGAPMWGNGNGRGNKQQPQSNAEILQLIQKQQAAARVEASKNIPGKVLPTSEASTSKQLIDKIPQKPKTSLLKKPLAAIQSSKIKSLVSADYNELDDSSNGTPPISPLGQQKLRQKTQDGSKTEEVVIVDSSPDEKQRMIDYDDDNDKVVTTLTEVSLNSTAQDICDSDDMIETFDTSELVSSPLDTVAESTDYALFEPHVVHIDDSNESLKEIMNTNLFEDTIPQEPSKDNTSKDMNSDSEVMFIIEPEKDKSPKSVGTREDFEAMIDSGKDDDNESETEISSLIVSEKLETVESEKPAPTQVKVTIAPMCDVKKELKISPVVYSSAPSPVSLTLPANLMARPNITSAGVSTHKKIVKPTQTTAKVSIGNTTISVPVVLKNMPISTQNKGGGECSQGSKKIITTNALTLSQLKKNPGLLSMSGQKINTSTIVTLSLNKGNNRSIQTVQRIQQKPGQQSIIVPISTCVTSSPSSIASSVEIMSCTQNPVISKLSTSRSSPILTFSSKMPTLTMTQDTSLPTKIFEDEEISPDAQDCDDIEGKIKDGQCEKTSTIDNKTEDANRSTENQPDGKLKSVMPVHVIVKSRESSQSPTTQQSRTMISSNMSQLSPLSQPIEINTNTANATQQIRSIMSSINSSEDQKIKAESEQMSATSLPLTMQKTIMRSSSTPANINQPEIKMIVSQSNASILSSPNVQTSQSGNILLVKQIRTSSASPASTLPSSSNSAQVVVVSQSGQMSAQGQVSSVIISNKPSNLLSILSNQQTPSTQQIQKSGDIKMEFSSTVPEALIGGAQKTVTILKSNPTITNLLNTNAYKRSKSTDDVMALKEQESSASLTKRLSLEASNAIKTEPVETPCVSENSISVSHVVSSTAIKSEPPLMNVSVPKAANAPVSKPEDSQNVLLKQLLQNCGTGSSVNSPMGRTVPGLISSQRAPSLGVFSSLEAQLARPVIPPAPTKQIIMTQPMPISGSISSPIDSVPKTTVNTSKVVSRETSFVSAPPPSILQTSIATSTSSISPAIDKKPVVVLNRSDIPMSLMMPGCNTIQLPRSVSQPSPSEISGMAPPNSGVKKEMISPGGTLRAIPSPTNIQPLMVKSFSHSSINSGTTTPIPLESPLIDVKKEIMDDSSQSESISSDVSMAKNDNLVTTPTTHRDDGLNEQMNESPEKTAQEIANELKKKKRREYQKNRRQMQMSKEKGGLKKPRKLQKTEEDYDSFIDNLMVQIKSLPQMQILEPLLPKNFNVCPIYGCTDLNKLNSSKRYNITSGELTGNFGNAELSNVSDFYNTKPFGIQEPKVEQAPISTQRGFYDQEFPPIKFEEEGHHRSKYDLLAKDRDADTPDTIVSSSSPECVSMAPVSRYPGLKLIREDDEEDEMTSICQHRMSPTIPTIIAPIPIRLKSGFSLTTDNALSDKENDIKQEFGIKSCFGPPTPLKDANNNVTVTLTLTSSAAEDIMGVLKALANILHIPAPTAYQIVERTTTPPSQKLGLYRTKGKDGKEGQPVDIQTILNGTAKFCRHCDVVILNNVIKARANEFPLLINAELESDELYFCGPSCYKQFQWRPINMLDDKAINPSSDDKTLEGIQDTVLKVESQEGCEMRKEISIEKRKLEEIVDDDEELQVSQEKRQKLMRIKTFSANSFPQIHKQKKLSERDVTEMLFRMNITVNSAPKIVDDTRKCIFCHQIGDGVADGPSRLLNYDVDKWVHLNCALWSDGVYETVNGALMNLEATLQQSLNSKCTLCNHLGATIKCFKPRCGSIYHLSCAMKDNGVFYKNKTTMCNIHAPKSEKDNELTTLSVQRRVYIERDENRQVASIMHHSDLANLMRVGSLILLNVGQLLPHQLQAFHTPNYIYPIGFKIIRFFWSMRHPNKRCRYICYIVDVSGRPEFRIMVKEPNEEDTELRDDSPKKVWQRILASISKLRKDNQLVQVFPKYVSGEDLFGLTEPAVVRILESLPGVETLHDYRFKYGRNPLLELPLAINPSGAARTEPRQRSNMPWKKPHTQRTGSSSQRPAFVAATSAAGEVACPYSKQFVHSKSSQYKKMKLEWRNNVFLARSKIQGLGLYAARDLEKHTMVIEYIGEVIRGELSELREKQYEAKNRGIYMFRLDEDRVIDATLSGGLARYINHSCNPNCVTEVVEVDREYRIIIFAKRRINRGEELSYDYKFDIEDESRKIACACDAPNCKKYLN